MHARPLLCNQFKPVLYVMWVSAAVNLSQSAVSSRRV